MLKSLVYRLLKRRHYWRYAGFDELSELYTSMMLRSIGLSLVGIFVPIYLFKLGFGLPAIFLFMAGLFATRLIGNALAGLLIARIGPKHTMLYSYLVQALSLIMLLTLPQLHWPLWVIAVTWGVATSLFFVAYHVDFSKIMHADHGGKELGIMTIVERLGGVLGPLIGGIIATTLGAEYTIAIAIILFLLAVLPLFMTAEPMRTHQKLDFRGLPYGKLKRDFFSFMMVGVDSQTALAAWPLYLAVTLLTVNTYASVGLVTSVGVVAAMLAAKFIGSLIDHNKGGVLLKWSAWAAAITHAFRPFMSSLSGILAVNIANDSAATGFRLPYSKGMYSRADELPGFRIVYLVVIETMGDLGKTLVWLTAWLVSLSVGPIGALEVSFFVAAVATALISVQNFPALKRRRFI